MPTQQLRKKSNQQLPEISIFVSPQKIRNLPNRHPNRLNLQVRFGRFVQQLGFLCLHCIELLLELPSFHLLPSNFHLSAMGNQNAQNHVPKLKTLQVRLCFIFLLKQQEFLCNRSILFLSAKTWRCHMSTHVLQGHLQGGGLLAGSLFQLGFQCHQSILPFRLSRDLDPTWKMLAFKIMVLFHLNCDRLGTKFGTKLASLLSHLESRDIKKGT